MGVSRVHALALSALMPICGGCGAGVAGVVASASDSGGGGNSAPSIANLQVFSSRVSPATIRFELSDREGETAAVELFARVPLPAGGLGAPLRLEHVSGPGFPANGAAVAIPPGNQAAVIEAAWRFPEESFLPDDARFVEGLELTARLNTGGELTLGDDEPLSVGNDAPKVTAVTPIVDPAEGEVAGITRIGVTLEDSSDDVVSVRAEYDIQGDEPDAGRQPATGFGLGDVRVSRTGTTLDFFWDTNADLGDLERDVRLCFTATDGLADGPARESAPFRVDNNAEPLVTTDTGFLVSNPDLRRGIPVPYRVTDEEDDPVRVVFQWRRPAEAFPPLDLDGDGSVESDELERLLRDPAVRRERHVCTPYPRFARGRVQPIGEETVRLPELALGESWVLASGIEGSSLELMRPSVIPEPVTPSWSPNPLVSPVAALPVGDGLTALVLDAPGGSGRLREIELATGKVVREIAALDGRVPTAMTFEQHGEAVLAATDQAGFWRIERVELASGAITELVASDGTQPCPVRGIASLGQGALVFTAGSALLFLDYRGPAGPRDAVAILEGLEGPHGVVVDPLNEGSVYLAERDAPTPAGRGRILAVQLDAHAKVPVVVGAEPMLTLERPEALALERGGTRLLVVVTNARGERELFGLDLGGGNAPFRIGEALPSGTTSIATGPDGLRLLASLAEDELLFGGGLVQRRTIANYDADQRLVVVDSPFQPPLRPNQPWRIPTFAPNGSSPTGRTRTFVWDSNDLPQGGPVFLRVLPFDTEPGPAFETSAAKRVLSSLDVEPLRLEGISNFDPESITSADLDLDGDLDLATANGNGIHVFAQGDPGTFDSAPVFLREPGTSYSSAISAPDLDGDGRPDLLSAGPSGDSIVAFLQEESGGFAALVLPVPGGESPSGADPFGVTAADLDGDGDLDLVSANRGRDDLAVFFQIAHRSFGTTPALIAVPSPPGTRSSPSSVAAADLDGDGDVDLVTRNSGAGNIAAFTQETPGAFASVPLELGVPDHKPVSVTTGDLDHDGGIDIVSANSGSSLDPNLTVFFRSSAGDRWEDPLVIDLSPAGARASPNHVTVADLDTDGILELIAAHGFANSPENVSVFYQVQARTFDPDPLLFSLSGAIGGQTTTLVSRFTCASDLNADGLPDLAVANIQGITCSPSCPSGFVAVFLQDRPRPEASAPLVLRLPQAAFGLEPRRVRSADLDEDGAVDLVSANLAGHNLTVFFQRGPGIFDPTPSIVGDISLTGGVQDVTAGDLDRDGDLDLVPCGNRGRRVFLQVKPGAFEATSLSLGFPTGEEPALIAAVDLDGDAGLDLISNANVKTGNGLALLFQSGPTTFELRQSPLETPAFNFAVATGDLDGDGDLDIATNGETVAAVFFQSSSGNFAPEPLLLPVPGFGVQAVEAADIEGDGDVDLVSLNSFKVFLQVGPGTFEADPQSLDISPFATAAAIGDLEGDGDQDLAFAATVVSIHNQRAPGVFDPDPFELSFPQPFSECTSIALTDLDGDGDTDIVAAYLVSSAAVSGNLAVFWGGR